MITRASDLSRPDRCAPARDSFAAPLSTAPWTCGLSIHDATPWTLEDANRFCLDLVRDHYENFPVGLPVFTRGQRDALAAIYAFARIADDFADEPSFDGTRENLLDAWERQLLACFEGQAHHPVFVALSGAARGFDLPLQPFLDLLDAFRQDCRQTRYETFDQLLDYCRRSANPVGRLVLRVLGMDRAALAGWSDCICTALQLTNHWQDLSVDVARNRIYLPLEDLERFRVTEEQLLQGSVPQSFGDLVVFEAERTRGLYLRGSPLLRHAEPPANLYLAAVYIGGRAVLRMVRRSRREVLFRRPAIGLRSMARTLVEAGMSRLVPNGKREFS